MSGRATKYRCLIISPSDAEEERQSVANCIGRFVPTSRLRPPAPAHRPPATGPGHRPRPPAPPPSPRPLNLLRTYDRRY